MATAGRTGCRLKHSKRRWPWQSSPTSGSAAGNHSTKIRFGVAAIVPHAFGLALLNSWTQQPTTMRPVSPITVLILFFGMLAPAKPTQMLAATLIAASMDPLGVWIAHLRGLETPGLLNTFAMFY